MIEMLRSTMRKDFGNALLPLRLAIKQGPRGFMTGFRQGWPASLFSVSLSLMILQIAVIVFWVLGAVIAGFWA